MKLLKEKLFRDIGDEGADTHERYYAQIQYTAFWCIRMLIEEEEIEAVIPEGGEDLVIIRKSYTELHQIKTRDEGIGAWILLEVVKILCQQYNRKDLFPGECHFHFVSDHKADTKSNGRELKCPPLYNLKHLLEIKNSGQPFDVDEQTAFNQFEKALFPKIVDIMDTTHEKIIDTSIAEELLGNTYIDTDNEILRDCRDIEKTRNILYLDEGLQKCFPGMSEYTYSKLKAIYDCILFLIITKILKGRIISEREIHREDILECCSKMYAAPSDTGIDWDSIPGVTLLDKKVRLGKFDEPDGRKFHRQKALAENIRRKYLALGMEQELEHFTVELLDFQSSCRYMFSESGKEGNPGPAILNMISSGLAELATKYFPDNKDIDVQFCKGILWRETNLCNAYWHPY